MCKASLEINTNKLAFKKKTIGYDWTVYIKHSLKLKHFKYVKAHSKVDTYI